MAAADKRRIALLSNYKATPASIKAAPSGCSASAAFQSTDEKHFSRIDLKSPWKYLEQLAVARHPSTPSSRMRRTRHVVLPVRSWQYIGLLIVSLACLTLGLVSRDREGLAGSLVGPELTHRAPHEVDACPNLKPFVKSPIADPEEVTKPINNHEMKVSESRVPSTSQKFVLPRSQSLDRLPRSDSRKIRDVRTIEGLSRLRTRVSDESVNRFRESRFRTITQSRDATRSSYDPATRLARSRDLSSRATGRRLVESNLERRLAGNSRSAERRELDEIARRQNRVVRLADRQQDSRNLQRRTSDYRDGKSLSTERRTDLRRSREVIGAEKREYRDLTRDSVPSQRSEIRERQSRSVERRVSIERRDAIRSDRREDRINLLNRSARFMRGDVDRNNNMDRRNRERSPESRRAALERVAEQSDDRRALSRSMKRYSDINNRLNRETLSRRVRSIETNTERRSLVRSMERREDAGRQKAENRFGDRESVDRVSRERIDFSQRTASRRDSRVNAAVRANYRARYNVEEIARRERSERLTESRSVDRSSMERWESARIRDSRDHDRRSRDSAPAERRESANERRERTSFYRSREERRIVPQRSREIERRASEQRGAERRVLERQVALNSRRLSERRIDDSLKSREGSRLADRRSERSLESRISRGRILEKRSVLDSRRLSERRIDDSLKSREGSRLANRRLERSLESRGGILERRSALDSRRLSERRIDDSLKSREGSRLANRRLERSLESRGGVLERRSALDSRRSSDRRLDEHLKSRQEFRLADRRSERSLESRISSGRILERRSVLDSQRSSERRIDNSKLRQGSRLAGRRLERNPESRVSRGRILERRSAIDSRRIHDSSRTQDRRVERNSELRNSIPTERRANFRTASLENQVLRSAETQREIRHLTDRRVARSVDQLRENESIRHLRQGSTRNIKDSSRLSSLRRVVRIPEQNNREQRRSTAERMLARTVDSERLSAKWERNLQDAHVERNVVARARIVPYSMKDYEFSKYPTTYELMRQAFVVALCTVYGLSLYNGKKSSFGSNIMQHAQRFIIW